PATRGRLGAWRVPLPPQRRERPRHLHVRAYGALVQPLLDQFERPVVAVAGRTAVRPQSSGLPWGRIKGEPVRLVHQHATGRRAWLLGRLTTYVEHRFEIFE